MAASRAPRGCSQFPWRFVLGVIISRPRELRPSDGGSLAALIFAPWWSSRRRAFRWRPPTWSIVLAPRACLALGGWAWSVWHATRQQSGKHREPALTCGYYFTPLCSGALGGGGKPGAGGAVDLFAPLRMHARDAVFAASGRGRLGAVLVRVVAVGRVARDGAAVRRRRQRATAAKPGPRARAYGGRHAYFTCGTAIARLERGLRTFGKSATTTTWCSAWPARRRVPPAPGTIAARPDRPARSGYSRRRPRISGAAGAWFVINHEDMRAWGSAARARLLERSLSSQRDLMRSFACGCGKTRDLEV
jgi:hypothetical protein